MSSNDAWKWSAFAALTVVECEHPLEGTAWRLPFEGYIEEEAAEDLAIEFFRRRGFTEDDTDIMREYMTVQYLLMMPAAEQDAFKAQL